MTMRRLLAIMLLSTALSAHAQLTIGGTPLVYDKLTKTIAVH